MEIIDLASGKTVAEARSPHPPTTPPVSEQDPTAWWDALIDCMQQVSDHLPSVRAMAVSGQQHGLVVLDRNNQPLRPAKLWNDTTSAAQSEALINGLGAESWAQLTGSVPGPAFTVTKLAWLAENEPDVLTNVVRAGLPHDYLNLRLTGRWVTDRGDASGTGYWSATTGSYVEQAWMSSGAGAIEFPTVAAPFDAIGVVTAPELLELGLHGDVIVGPGSGDNMCAALGLGLAPGDLVVSLGTSGTAYSVSSTATNDPTGLVAGFADASGHFLPLVCTLNATKVTDSIRNLLNVSYEEMDTLALSAPQGANGVILIPFFDGERTPNLPDSAGSLVGLRTSVERRDIARAAFEGVACGLLDGVDALHACGVATNGRFFLIGGGSKSRAAVEVFASLSDREITVPSNDETVARGAGVQAACVLTSDAPADFAQRWNLSAGDLTTPPATQGAAPVTVRDRYRTAVTNQFG